MSSHFFTGFYKQANLATSVVHDVAGAARAAEHGAPAITKAEHVIGHGVPRGVPHAAAPVRHIEGAPAPGGAAPGAPDTGAPAPVTGRDKAYAGLRLAKSTAKAHPLAVAGLAAGGAGLATHGVDSLLQPVSAPQQQSYYPQGYYQ